MGAALRLKPLNSCVMMIKLQVFEATGNVKWEEGKVALVTVRHPCDL